MTPQQHARAKEIFLAAVRLPPAQRDSLIARQCGGDPPLEREVRGLIEAHVSEPAASPRAAASSTEGRDFPPGTVIAERYRIIAPLGAGGMGEVYRADDLTLEQPVALKFLPREWAKDPRWIARLRNEARLARTVTHAHVCRIHDLCEWNNEFFLSMEYVEGEDLGSLLRRIGRLPVDKAVDVSRQICLGLAVAHQADVLHRDLKPANIMLDSEGRARITDFGIAAMSQSIPAHDIRTGTTAYMAPEQLTGRQVSIQSDLYALGLVMYELFTGRPAFQADTSADYVRLHQHALPAPPSQFATDIPPDVEQVILSCLRKDPKERPASALIVAASLPRYDVLNDALAVNLTPSPDLVAAARPAGPDVSTRSLAAATAIVLVLTVALRSFAIQPWDHLGTLPPSVLGERARALLESVGVAGAGGQGAYGYCGPEEVPSLWDSSLAARALEINTPAGPVFWYRTGGASPDPTGVSSIMLGSGRVTITDPAPFAPGMATVVLDLSSRLILFAHSPASRSDQAVAASSQAVHAPLLLAAGLSSDDLSRTPLDGGLLWTSQPASPAAWSAGNDGPPRFFARVRARGSAANADAFDLRKKIGHEGVLLLFVVMAGVALPIAWRGYRAGRIDREGGLALAAFVVSLEFIIVLLRAANATAPSNIVLQLAVGVLHGLGLASLLAAFYVVVDAYARRQWPNVLITWNRALRRRFRDADVRRHVATGVFVGCLWAFFTPLERALVHRTGWQEAPFLLGARVAEKVYGVRDALASFLGAVPQAIAYALLMLMLLVTVRMITRSPRWATLITAIVLAPIFLTRGAHPVTAILFFGVGALVASLWLLTKVGLLALAAALLVASILNTIPITLTASAWYADLTAFGLAFVVALAAYGLSGSVHVSRMPRTEAATP
jgi:serine/threonine-protein kinase